MNDVDLSEPIRPSQAEAVARVSGDQLMAADRVYRARAEHEANAARRIAKETAPSRESPEGRVNG